MGTLYERIISLCQDHGITGGKLCTDLNMSKGTLTDLKMGRQTGISAAKAQKIADYFGVTVGYLLGKEEKPTVTGEQKENSDQLVLTGVDKELYELLMQIPEEQKKLFLEMGRVFVNNLNKD